MGEDTRRWNGRAGWGASCVACLLALSWLLRPGSAQASETRLVAGGQYELTVGFVVEPAFEGEPNGLNVRVVELDPATAEPSTPPATPSTEQPTDAAEVTPTPLPGAELTAILVHGDRTQPLPLQADSRAGMVVAVEELLALVAEDGEGAVALRAARTTLEVLLGMLESAAGGGARVTFQGQASA